MDNIKISIITASYNYENYIKETIESVMAQTYQNWEMIIVDDGSKDNSVEVIKKYCEKDSRIKLYQHEGGVNKGLRKTVMYGIELAQTEWIAFLESDDTITPDYLEEKVKVIKENPQVGFIFNDITTFGNRVGASGFDNWFKDQREIIAQRGNFANYFDVFVDRNIVPTFSVVMVKKEIMQSLDYSTSGGEPRIDHYLWEQIALNHNFYYINKKLTNWRMHHNSYISTPLPEINNLMFAWNFYRLSIKKGYGIFKYLGTVIKALRKFIFRSHMNKGKILLFGKWYQLCNKKDNAVLVTGGAGFIGSHCVLELLKNDYNVIIYDNLSTGNIKTVKELQKHGNVKFINGDLQDAQKIYETLRHEDIKAVIHTAGIKAKEGLFAEDYYLNNVYGTINLLNAMAKNYIDKIIYSSTAEIYGEPKYTPMDEFHPLLPQSIYANTALITETMLNDYEKSNHIRSMRLRYFDNTDAETVAKAHVEALKHLKKEMESDTFNIGEENSEINVTKAKNILGI